MRDSLRTAQKVPQIAANVETTLAVSLVAVTLVAAVCTVHWRIVHDAALMQYVAWRVQAGAVPYVDVEDMNFPGAWALQMLLAAFDGGDRGFRVLDLSTTLLGAGAVALAVPGRGRLPAAAAFAALHLAGGEADALQRDFVVAVLAAVACTATVRDRRFLAGFAAGAAATIKPTGAVLAIVLALLESSLSSALALLVAAAIAPTLMLVWLAHRGALAAFIEVLQSICGPYSNICPYGWGVVVWLRAPLCAVLVAVAAAVGRSARAKRVSRPGALWGVALAFGLFHYVFQGKGWPYHLYPAFAPAIVLAANARPSLERDVLAIRGVRAALLFVLHVKLGMLALPFEALEARVRVRDAMLEDVAACTPGSSWAFVDQTEGAAWVAWRRRQAPPQRLVHELFLFAEPRSPGFDAWRDDFLEDVDRARPDCILVTEEGWPFVGYERLGRVPALQTRITSRYHLWRERSDVPGLGYRLYKRLESNDPVIP